jgi:hypothetical protein
VSFRQRDEQRETSVELPSIGALTSGFAIRDADAG